MLLDAAVVTISILEPQAHLRSVLFEVKQLFGVEGSTSLPEKQNQYRMRGEPEKEWHQLNCLVCFEYALSYKLHRILIFHPALD